MKRLNLLAILLLSLTMVFFGCGGDDGDDNMPVAGSGGAAGEAGAGGAAGEAGAGGAAGEAGAGGAAGEAGTGGAAGEAGAGGAAGEAGTGGMDECGDVQCEACDVGNMPVDMGGCCPVCVEGCADDSHCPAEAACFEGACVQAFTQTEADDAIRASCGGCHTQGGSGSGRNKGWDQMGYQEVLGRVTGTTGPLMPQGGPRWSEEKILRLRLLAE